MERSERRGPRGISPNKCAASKGVLGEFPLTKGKHGQSDADIYHQPYGCSRQGLTKFSSGKFYGSDRELRIVLAELLCQSATTQSHLNSL